MIPQLLPICMALLSSKALAAYVPDSGSSWTTLTPTTTLSGAETDYPNTFGIAIQPVASAASSKATDDSTISISIANKRDSVVQPVSQIGDGQIQGTYTSTLADDSVTTIYASHIATVTASNTITAVSSGLDTKVTTATYSATSETDCTVCETSFSVYTITDDESPSSSTTDCDYTTYTTTVLGTTYIVESSIDGCDADANAITETPETNSVTTIFSTTSFTPTSNNISTTFTSSYTDSQASETASFNDNEAKNVACKVNGTLTMTLKNSILKDSADRIGSVVANRQFQFDGPTPQAGAIYAAGWGVLEGKLALANSTVFYQCLSGTFYNLYDENIGSQCSPVYLELVDLVDC